MCLMRIRLRNVDLLLQRLLLYQKLVVSKDQSMGIRRTMNRRFSVLILISCIMHTCVGGIVLRLAQQADLTALLELDRQCSFEYWKPLFLAGYTHVPVGNQVDQMLEEELIADQKLFANAVSLSNNMRLLAAYNVEENKPVGLLLFDKADERSIQLDLLMVDKAYRRKGIGKQLIDRALAEFPAITICDVTPLRFANDQTIKFYEAYGFERIGFRPIDNDNASELSLIKWFGPSYTEMFYHYRWRKSDLSTPTMIVTKGYKKHAGIMKYRCIK